MSSVHEVEIELGVPVVGNSKVVVDGHDISTEVSRIVVDASASRDNPIAKVILEGWGKGRIKVNGEVLEHLDQRQAAVEFLLTVDPQKLEQEALASMGLDAAGPQTAGEAILMKLITWAGGNPDGTGPSSG
jgi:hypothetical protein